MVEKKRKTAVSASAPPPKKSKKAPASEPILSSKSTDSENAPTSSTTNDVVTKSKTSRKRAADFLGNDETQSTPPTAIAETTKSVKKSKKNSVSESRTTTSKKSVKNSLTADGINGVVENEDSPQVDVVTANETASASLEAEGLRTAEKLLDEENASQDEDNDEDQGAVLLAGFDSDSEDLAEDQGDMSRTQPIPQYKKTSKKLKQAKEKGSDGPGTVYVGRIPHGFYEKQMKDYFTQFGEIARLRLSRNRRTGASKHFAFIEFESDEVAKIVADTMDNYLMFGHILKCKYAPSENLHPDVWKGANKKYRKIPHQKLQRQQLEAPKTQEQWTKKNTKEQKKRQQQAEKLKAIGYEYTIPELKDPATAIEEQRAEEKAHGIPEALKTSEEEPDAIEAPPAAPADEVALKKEKKTKKSKSKANGVQESLTQGNLIAKDAGPAAESAKISQNAKNKKEDISSVDTVPIPAAAPSKKSKKGKKDIGSESSTHGDYDNLSSIGVGVEAAPASVTDAVQAPSADSESIFTHDGVADTVLAGRKSDRKSDRKKAKTEKSTVDKAKTRAEVNDIAPSAVRSNDVEKGKKLKGILKKGRKAAE